MTLERIKEFSKSQQLLILGSEFKRAEVWQEKDEEKYKAALDRALQILDLIAQDEKWQEQKAMLEGLGEEIVRFRQKENAKGIEALYRAL